jgi:VIT1/CCC1 family predicted Fe2+/Mn2+ transporter
VSVSSQADTEGADLARERQELASAPESERAELERIYVSRGLSPELAAQVAGELMAHDALGAHARDELGMSESTRARPIQAALASAAAFAVGAALPLALAALWPPDSLSLAVGVSSMILLAVLGGTAARLGGAPLAAGAARVAFWGVVAMACTALVGRMFGTTVQ